MLNYFIRHKDEKSTPLSPCLDPSSNGFQSVDHRPQTSIGHVMTDKRPGEDILDGDVGVYPVSLLYVRPT